MEYDPERELWLPGRRTFLFMLGSAAVGTLIPPANPVIIAEFSVQQPLVEYLRYSASISKTDAAKILTYLAGKYSIRLTEAGDALIQRVESLRLTLES